ncbi:oxaloacetate decarboxylase [Reyranella sp. CPCC 100927]|uniref:isocitrate lyase/PEP mutase family protein n=1 Tax=Reyranella sp. CPCC 100927 TaxID=2599616 RepID=UPI0015B60C33|nr:isocitrate lyase/PEP mutase family protein [Reyranella sp. CPCC 100927]
MTTATAVAPRPTWRELLARERPLVLPGAYDALSARLIQRAGFPAYIIGGYPVVGARYGLPDVGLCGLGEISAGIRDIMDACTLPVLIDADDGYGDVKNVTRTIRTYERMGAAAIFIEDQVSPKRCGHMEGKDVVPAEVMERKIRAAAAARENKETFLIARTDARAIEGLDGALRRAERYVRAGADGIFVEAPLSVAELERIGREIDVPQFCNMLDGGKTPILSNRELYEMGFEMVVLGTTLIMRVARLLRDTLADLRQDQLSWTGTSVTFDEYKDMVGFPAWTDIETRFS